MKRSIARPPEYAGWLDIHEAARRWGVSVKRVYKWMKGRGGASRGGGLREKNPRRRLFGVEDKAEPDYVKVPGGFLLRPQDRPMPIYSPIVRPFGIGAGQRRSENTFEAMEEAQAIDLPFSEPGDVAVIPPVGSRERPEQYRPKEKPEKTGPATVETAQKAAALLREAEAKLAADAMRSDLEKEELLEKARKRAQAEVERFLDTVYWDVVKGSMEVDRDSVAADAAGKAAVETALVNAGIADKYVPLWFEFKPAEGAEPTDSKWVQVARRKGISFKPISSTLKPAKPKAERPKAPARKAVPPAKRAPASELEQQVEAPPAVTVTVPTPAPVARPTFNPEEAALEMFQTGRMATATKLGIDPRRYTVEDYVKRIDSFAKTSGVSFAAMASQLFSGSIARFSNQKDNPEMFREWTTYPAKIREVQAAYTALVMGERNRLLGEETDDDEEESEELSGLSEGDNYLY